MTAPVEFSENAQVLIRRAAVAVEEALAAKGVFAVIRPDLFKNRNAALMYVSCAVQRVVGLRMTAEDEIRIAGTPVAINGKDALADVVAVMQSAVMQVLGMIPETV